MVRKIRIYIMLIFNQPASCKHLSPLTPHLSPLIAVSSSPHLPLSSSPPLLISPSPYLSSYFLIKISYLPVEIVPGIDFFLPVEEVEIQHGEITCTHGCMDKQYQ